MIAWTITLILSLLNEDLEVILQEGPTNGVGGFERSSLPVGQEDDLGGVKEPSPMDAGAGTSGGEGTSGTKPLLPWREDSPVPSISSQGSSWIEGLYGTTGDEIASHSNPPSSRPQAENPDPQDNEAKKLSAQPPVEIEEELPVPTIQEVKEEMRHFFNHFRKNQTPDRFINSTAEEISLAQASAAKRRAIVQLMDEIAENSSTITQGGGVVASAQDARAELTERLDRWAGEHET